MPRPRVKPEDRLRAERACDPCKAAKKRCDGAVPCSACCRKGVPDSCAYTARKRRGHPRMSMKKAAEQAATAMGMPPVNIPLSQPLVVPEVAENHMAQGPVVEGPMTESGMVAVITPSIDRPVMESTIPVTSKVHNETYVSVPRVEVPTTPSYASRPQQHSLFAKWTSAARHADFEEQWISEQKPVMLVSSSGEKVFVGNTAAISFLTLLQNVVKRYIGPSKFTDLQRDRKMLEVDVPEIPCEDFEHSLGDIDSEELINVFLQASCGLFDLFSEEELATLCSRRKSSTVPTAASSPATPASSHTTSSTASNRSELDDAASFYAIIAIGAQCRWRDDNDNAIATRYFNQARNIAFQGWLQDPTVGLVRTFVLLAFYMLGACRRNAAFMYIGVASKAAIVLGLHVPSDNKNMDKAEMDQRNRVGMSVRVLDLVCSSILGRPGTTLPLAPGTGRLSSLDPSTNRHRTIALSASYEACFILEAIVREFACHGSLSVDSTETFLGQLAEWAHGLPTQLRGLPLRRHDRASHSLLSVNPRMEAQRKSKLVGNIHTACTYYFGVILVTRQYMIHHIMSRLEMKTTGDDAVPVPLTVEGSSTMPTQTRVSSDPDGWRKAFDGQPELVKKYSDRCVDAALYLAQHCIDAHSNGDLLNIMCALKAWMFVSGLVLGFALLLERTAETERWSLSFHGVKGILQGMAQVSAQAKQYSLILISFYDAILAYNHNQAANTNARDTTVERILSVVEADDPPAYSSYANDAAVPDTADPETTSAGTYLGTEMPAYSDALEGLAAVAGPFEQYAADFTSILGGNRDMGNQWVTNGVRGNGGDMGMALPDVMALFHTFTNEFGQT